MFYLIYVSTPVTPMEDDALLSLLEECRETNHRLGITGMLLYKNGDFMQMLEGDKQVVMELYDAIRKDERHKDVITIMTGDIRKRNFESWSMGFCNMDKSADVPDYDEYIRGNLLFRSFQDDAHRAFRFMLLFNAGDQ